MSLRLFFILLVQLFFEFMDLLGEFNLFFHIFFGNVLPTRLRFVYFFRLLQIFAFILLGGFIFELQIECFPFCLGPFHLFFGGKFAFPYLIFEVHVLFYLLLHFLFVLADVSPLTHQARSYPFVLLLDLIGLPLLVIPVAT